jgi:hypothetical protein
LAKETPVPLDEAAGDADESVDYFGDESLALNPYPLLTG